MEHEIITLEEKTVIGITARTNNLAPDMGNIIGALWQRFYSEEIYSKIPDKINGKALGIYMEYAGNEWQDYTVMTACEVKTDSTYLLSQCVDDIKVLTIPAGRYAKFIVKGDMHTAVAEAWQQIWNMNLSRSFICDFEEYQNEDMKQSEIHIYIGLTE